MSIYIQHTASAPEDYMSLKIQHTASCKLYTSPRLQIESTAQSRFPIVIFILILVYTTQQDRDLCVYTFFFFWFMMASAVLILGLLLCIRCDQVNLISSQTLMKEIKKGERYSTSSDVDAD